MVMAGNEEGGLELHFETLCNMLSTHHEIHVVAHEKYRERFGEGVWFHALDLSRGRKNPLILYALYQKIRRIAPDIVHAHANKAAGMIASLRLFLPRGIKYVATLHSQKRNLKVFERFDHVIGVSHTVIEPLKGLPASVVYNGIDIPKIVYDAAYLKPFGIGEDDFVLFAVGRMERVKNFSLLLEAVAPLDVHLLLVGEGSQKEMLKKRADELGIGNRVHFTGFREDVPQLLYHSDLCVISSDREGFSYVMAEALLLEKPVLSTDVGDMRRILPEQYVVPVGDAEALRNAIISAKESYMDTCKAYAQSFAFAKTHFTPESMVEGVLHIYKEVSKR
jgi:glycosyltransferase involved in cell wall biosynthesis